MTARPLLGRAVLAAVVVIVAVPAMAVVAEGFRTEDGVGFDAVSRMFGSARTWRIIAVTIGQAVASAVVTIAVGLPVAWVLHRFRFPGRRLLLTISVVPFVLPSVVIGAAFASLLGPGGVVDLRGTWWAIIAAHLCFNLAVVLRAVTAAMGEAADDLEANARMLGCTPWQAFIRAVLPSIRGTVTGAALIVFLFCLTSFGVVVILGGGPVTTLEVELWTRATRQFDLSGAGILALVQLIAVLATLALQSRVASGAAGVTRGGARGPAPRGDGTSGHRRPSSLSDRLAVGTASLAVVVISVAPLVALVERSVRGPDGPTLQHWRNLGSVTAGTGLRVSPFEAVAMSLRSTAIAAVVAVVVALVIVRALDRRRGAADDVVLLPLGVSSTTLGLGLLLVAGRPPLDLRSSWWLVPLAQALVAMPLVVRTILPVSRSLSPSLFEAAATLGASSRRRWWQIELPLLSKAISAGAGLAVIACLGEFGATVFVARTTAPTVPVAIERLMSRPGGDGFSQAMALSCVLVLMCGLMMALIDIGGERRPSTGLL